MRKVEILELCKMGRETYQQGDVRQVDDQTAQRLIDRGWARDPETGEQGERDTRPVRVRPDGSQHGAKTGVK